MKGTFLCTFDDAKTIVKTEINHIVNIVFLNASLQIYFKIQAIYHTIFFVIWLKVHSTLAIQTVASF